MAAACLWELLNYTTCLCVQAWEKATVVDRRQLDLLSAVEKTGLVWTKLVGPPALPAIVETVTAVMISIQRLEETSRKSADCDQSIGTHHHVKQTDYILNLP